MNPYKTIWFAPKRTFENFFQSDSEQPIFFLPFLILGASFAIEQSYMVGNLFSDGAIIWTALIMIPVGIGLIYLVFGLILPGLTRLIGTIWKGSSTPREMRNVYSISMIPYGILLIYQIALFGTGKEPLTENMNGVTHYIIRLWTFALLIIGIARVQRFNYGLALLNLLLTYLPFLLIALMIRG